MRRFLLLVLAGLLPAAPAAADMTAVLDALQTDGRVLLLRHAITEPGTGDPANFDINDPTTQRNLDHRGRAQSRAIGEALKAAGVRITKAQSSAWRRCMETAEIILDAADQSDVQVEAFEPLNSFFEDYRPRDRRVREANAEVAAWRGPGVLLMSTHMVNISGMTGAFTSQGGMLVLEPDGDGYKIVARGDLAR